MPNRASIQTSTLFPVSAECPTPMPSTGRRSEGCMLPHRHSHSLCLQTHSHPRLQSSLVPTVLRLAGFCRVSQAASRLFTAGLELSFLVPAKPVTACLPAFQLPTFCGSFLLSCYLRLCLKNLIHTVLVEFQERLELHLLFSLPSFTGFYPTICK